MPVTDSATNNTFLGIPDGAQITDLYNTWIEKWGSAIVNDKGKTLTEYFKIKED